VAWTWLVVRIVVDNWRAVWTPFFATCLAVALLFDALLIASVVFYQRFRRPVQNASLVVASSALVLFAADLLLNRILDVHRYAKIDVDAVVHHRLRPQARSLMASNEFSAEIATNSWGLRGPEPRADAARRVLLLGDSFTQGEGVDARDSFVARLEARLDEALPVPVEVINGGTDSYAPILSYLRYKNELRRLEPDVVVLNLDMSDLLQEQYYRSRARFGDDGEPLAVPNRRLEGNLAVDLEDWISRNFYVIRYLFLILRDALNGGAPETMEAVIQRQTGGLLQHTLVGDREDRGAQWRDLFDSVVRLDRLSREDGAVFMLALYPWGHQVNEREWVPGRSYWLPESARASEVSRDTVHNRCEANGIPFIDAFPHFRDYGGEKLLYFKYDMHFTPVGHDIMAGALFEPVLERLQALGS
jgi:lysophospholipase L1-like esterase